MYVISFGPLFATASLSKSQSQGHFRGFNPVVKRGEAAYPLAALIVWVAGTTEKAPRNVLVRRSELGNYAAGHANTGAGREAHGHKPPEMKPLSPIDRVVKPVAPRNVVAPACTSVISSM